MPELPEVEMVVRGLRGPLIGRTITGVWYEQARVIQMPDPMTFSARVTGQTIQAVERRAKYILCRLTDDILAIHLKMTGRLYVTPNEETREDDRWVRLKLALDNGCWLHFSDARRFGRVYLAGHIAEFAPDLGPEPLEAAFTVRALKARLAGRSRAIKALLLEQSFIAGVGNIYADEALYRARLHPLRPADSLTDREIRRLHRTIREALSSGIQHEGASVNWYRKPDGTRGESQDHFTVYGRDGQPCPRCGETIVKIRVAQRGTHFCPNCQPEG